MATKLIALPPERAKFGSIFGFKVNSQEKIINKKAVVCQMCERLLPNSGNMTNFEAVPQRICILLKVAKPPSYKPTKRTAKYRLFHYKSLLMIKSQI